jgi:hypothetical protein
LGPWIGLIWFCGFGRLIICFFERNCVRFTDIAIRGLTIRQYVWRGCSVSSESGACFSVNLSVKLSADLLVGCMLSVKESIRYEGSVSTYATASVGSAASVRSFMRLGLGVSVLSGSLVGHSVSVRGATRLGSACSLRSFICHRSSICAQSDARISGSSILIGGFTRFGSSLSVVEWSLFGSGTAGFSAL